MALGLATVNEATSSDTLPQASNVPLLLAVVVLLAPDPVAVALGARVIDADVTPWGHEVGYDQVTEGPSGVKTLGPGLLLCQL